MSVNMRKGLGQFHGLTLAAVLIAAGLLSGTKGANADDGRAMYEEHCSKCHGLLTEKNALHGAKVWLAAHAPRQSPRQYAIIPPYGPSLEGVFNRPAGAVDGFKYTSSFLEAAPSIVWNEEALDRWITNSQAMIRGSAMFLKIPEAEIRQAIIGYLKTHAQN